MAGKPLLLDGLVSQPKPDTSFEDWRRERQALESELRSLRSQLEEAKAENRKLAQSIKALRHTLSPLHTSLRALFGEIELAIGEEEFTAQAPAGAAPAANGSDPIWESYKQNFPGAPARIIDALITHRNGLTLTQISSLLKMHYNTAKDACAKLSKAGAITRDGGVNRLQQ